MGCDFDDDGDNGNEGFLASQDALEVMMLTESESESRTESESESDKN